MVLDSGVLEMDVALDLRNVCGAGNNFKGMRNRNCP